MNRACCGALPQPQPSAKYSFSRKRLKARMNNGTASAEWGTFLAEAATSPAAKTALLCLVGAGAGAALLTPVVMRVARWGGWVARPAADRWHDRRAVALMGGIAIFAAAALAVAFSGVAASLPWPVGAAATLLFAVGVADDLRGLSPRAKLLAQVAAAVLTVYAGVLFWESGPFWLSAPLTFLWVIGITNAFNLIDGMDGLAAGTGAIAAVTLALIAVHLRLPEPAGGAAAIAGAAAGFLLYNTYPARVFMGDGGSLFLGYALAAVAVAVQNGGAGAARPGAVLVPAVVLAVPIFDVVLVTVLRVAHDRPVAQGGTDHSMHRLAFLGLSERQTVRFLYGVSAGLGAVALLFYTNAILLFSALVLAALGALVVLGSHIGRASVYEESHENGDAPKRASSNGGTPPKSEPAGPLDAGMPSRPEPHGDGAGAPPQAGPLETGRLEAPLDGRRRTPEGRHGTFSERVGAVMQAFAGRYWKQAGGLLADTLVVVAAFLMAHALRFPGGMPTFYQTVMLQALPLVAGGKVALFYLMGVYHRLWPRAGTPEMVHLGKAVLLSSALTFAGLHAAYGGAVVSASALVVDMLLTGAGLGSTRFGFRALRQYIVHKQRAGDRVVICGAGAAGIMALRSLKFVEEGRAFHGVGFLDDAPERQGHRVKGLPVLGGLDRLEEICREHRVEGVVVNTAGHSEEQIEAIRRRCRSGGRTCYRLYVSFDALPDRAERPPPAAAPRTGGAAERGNQ